VDFLFVAHVAQNLGFLSLGLGPKEIGVLALPRIKAKQAGQFRRMVL
jgi:hypothetical protein